MGTLGLAGCSSDSSPGGNDGDEEDEPLACGLNAHAEDDECVCNGAYSPCDDAPDDCCAYFTEVFSIGIVSAKVVPFKDARNPWDWDGNVPDWLLDSLDILSYVVPQAQTWSEVADAVDEYAPELLESTVPPDPYFEMVVGDESAVSSILDDTYTPKWNEGLDVDLSGPALEIYFYDGDVAFDDEMPDGLQITADDAAHLAGGSWTLDRWGQLFELTFFVEPVD